MRLVVMALILLFTIFMIALLGWPSGLFNSKNFMATGYEIVTIKDSSCKECSTLVDIVKFIRESKVEVTAHKDLDFVADKKAAQDLIEKYNILKLPAMVIRGPKPTDPDLAKFWEIFGDNIGGDFVLRRVQPPYRDLASGQEKGLFKVTFLTDSACKTCYDVSLHENAFKNISMKIVDSLNLDISSAEGQALIKKYKIIQVPTILISGELDEYEGFQQAWPQVGSKEVDGTYVFRAGVAAMGTYRDLKTGKIVAEKSVPAK